MYRYWLMVLGSDARCPVLSIGVRGRESHDERSGPDRSIGTRRLTVAVEVGCILGYICGLCRLVVSY